MKQDPYATLGFPKDADKKKIKRAYRKRVKKDSFIPNGNKTIGIGEAPDVDSFWAAFAATQFDCKDLRIEGVNVIFTPK